MKKIIKEIKDIESRLESSIENKKIIESMETLVSLEQTCAQIAQAWSGGWLGYHAFIYKRDLKPRKPGESFDLEWGQYGAFGNTSTGEWSEFDPEALVQQIYAASSLTNPNSIFDLESDLEDAFQNAKDDLIIVFEANALSADAFLAATLEEWKGSQSHISYSDYVTLLVGKKQLITRDQRAVQGSLQVPPHIRVLGRVIEFKSHISSIQELLKLARKATKYIEARESSITRRIAVSSVTGNKIFLGHGRSALWRELKDLLSERLWTTPNSTGSQQLESVP